MEIAIIEGTITLIFKQFQSHSDTLQKQNKNKMIIYFNFL